MTLRARGLSKSFRSPRALTLFSSIDLDVAAGESVAILGRSGCGKSTLLQILGTLESPSSGSLQLCGEDALRGNLEQLRLLKIGFVFQSFHLLNDLSALENVALPARIARRSAKEALERSMELLEELSLSSQAHTPAKLLSGGEKQRVALARALCNHPALLLADEPTGNLDRESAKEVEQLLFSSCKQHGTALLLVTHDEALARRADRLLLLENGLLR